MIELMVIIIFCYLFGGFILAFLGTAVPVGVVLLHTAVPYLVLGMGAFLVVAWLNQLQEEAETERRAAQAAAQRAEREARWRQLEEERAAARELELAALPEEQRRAAIQKDLEDKARWEHALKDHLKDPIRWKY
jgi:hypothetical protein